MGRTPRSTAASPPDRRRLVCRLRVDQAGRTPRPRSLTGSSAPCSEKGSTGIPPATLTEIERLRKEYGFFHWHLEFPDIFHVDDDRPARRRRHRLVGRLHLRPGQPAVGQGDFEDKKYFQRGRTIYRGSMLDRHGVSASPSGRRNIRRRGSATAAARRKVKATFLFASSSGVYPQCAEGLTAAGVNSLQTDQLFAERFAAIIAPTGRVGCIIPTAIATGAGGQYPIRRVSPSAAP